MRKFLLPKEQSGIFAIPGIIIIAALVGIVALVIFLGQRQPKGEQIPIPPSQLMPEVTAAEARSTICSLRKEELFSEACQEKFNVVGKEDGKKIAELFALIAKIKNEKSISDYDRLLLSQAVFAALPNKDSPEAYLYQPALLSRLFLRPGIAFAQGQIMTEEEFKEMMRSDLKTMVDG
ncbi:hypothetical protein HY387_01285, partial [Candidatus Daviesbacteria bacterium]|nr:hypothetical protein [Candidatus Daviesbacteria bacterium]